MERASSPAAVLREHRLVPMLPSEHMAAVFFLYLLALGVWRQLPAGRLAMLAAPVVLIAAGVRMEQLWTRPWTRVLRAFLNIGLILAAYWSVAWFAGEHKRVDLQAQWLAWDRVVLYQWRLRDGVEALGGWIPLLLELVYLLFYAIPVLYLSILLLGPDRRRRRDDAHRFLLVLVTGALAVYACLPMFPVAGPRFAFPGVDLPGFESPLRWLNIWIHEHADISTSVFPSGHVGVAFSGAFALAFATPHRRLLVAAGFSVAGLVWVATVYCRYHYAVDGLASFCITLAVWCGLLQWRPGGESR